MNLNRACQELSKCFEAYKQHKKEDAHHRDRFIEELSGKRAERLGTKAESELKKLQQVMKQKRLGNKIRSNLPDKQRTATVQVFCHELGRRIDCLTKEEVEEACIQENKHRFTQNQDTPFLTAHCWKK